MTSLLASLEVVMTGTRFPENVGMAARACANMGCRRLSLAAPERWDVDKARPLATAKGAPLLESLRVHESLDAALADVIRVYGTTARTGGWRRQLLTPDEAAREMIPLLREGSRVALLFGPEDRGLSNEEIERCQRIVTIPVDREASSLNVAQSVLLCLYDVRREVLRAEAEPPIPRGGSASRRITQAEQEILYARIRETLLAIDYLHDNPDYFLMPLRRLLGQGSLRRHEMDMLMGICRQVVWPGQKKIQAERRDSEDSDEGGRGRAPAQSR